MKAIYTACLGVLCGLSFGTCAGEDLSHTNANFVVEVSVVASDTEIKRQAGVHGTETLTMSHPVLVENTRSVIDDRMRGEQPATPSPTAVVAGIALFAIVLVRGRRVEVPLR